MLGWTRWRSYRGNLVRRLIADVPPPFWESVRPSIPFIGRSRSGGITFDYDGQAIHAAEGLDEIEGELIVEWLARRLPASATSFDYTPWP